MNLTTICQGFPEIAAGSAYSDSGGLFIHRENLLDTIDDILRGDVQLVGVEGQEGIGKTCLLAQYAKRHPLHSISLFIRPASRYGFDPQFLRYDLCNQINWIVTDKEIEDPQEVDDTVLRSLITKLSRLARINQTKYCFVVDGLDEIPPDNNYVRQIVLDMLPLGLPYFRFLFSGDPTQLPETAIRSMVLKPFPMSGFTLDETRKYFNDVEIEPHFLEEIHRTCKKIPGWLATVKRILKSGVNVNDFVNSMPDQLPELFEVEWRNVNTNNRDQLLILALLAFDRKDYTIDEVSKVLNIMDVDQLISGLSFVCINNDNGFVSFVSEGYRNFVFEKLSHLKSDIEDLIIDYFLRDPESETALKLLPGYFKQAGRLEDLLDYLSPDRVVKMLRSSQSLSLVQQKIDLGVSTAKELDRDSDLMRFGVQNSLMKELSRAEVWRSEVEARTALKDFDSALALAKSTVLIEDKIHLLAVLAKNKREQGLNVEPEIVEEIRQLYKQINPEALGEKAIEIAIDLMYSVPDLAIELVERSARIEEGENRLDWAFAHLSAVALQTSKKESQNVDLLNKINTRINDPSARRFSKEISLLVGDYSANEVIAESEKLDVVSDRIYMLRKWSISNRRRTDAVDVIDYALRLVIQTTDYAPNASVLRELSTPLPFINDLYKAKHIVGSFDSQMGTIEPYGPTEDFVRLQLLLAETEVKYDLSASCNRVVEAYLYISALDDLAMKTVCLARLASALPKIDPEKQFEGREEIHSLVEEELNSYLELLLNSSADHYQATKGIINALSKIKPHMAEAVATKLNTEESRDLALLEIIRTILNMTINEVDFNYIYTLIEHICDLDYKDEAVMHIIERLASLSAVSTNIIEQVYRAIEHVNVIQDLTDRCKAYCYLYSVLHKLYPSESIQVREELLSRLEEAWNNIDVGWIKVDVGFKICSSLASENVEIARKYLSLSEQSRQEILTDANATAFSYVFSLKLAIRAFNGLLPKDINTDEDLSRLSRLVDQVPSHGERARLYADIAICLFLNDKEKEGKKIANEHVKPLINGMPLADAFYYKLVIASVGPALYCAHKTTAYDIIDKLPSFERDMAYWKICQLILTKQDPSDPYDHIPGQGYDVIYNDLVDICEILNRCGNDNMIFSVISQVCSSLVSGKKRFTEQQKRDSIKKLKEIVEEKLPNPRFITHEGYKIASYAEIYRVEKPNKQVWIDLLEKANNIPNVSDMAFVLGIIGVSMPSNWDRRYAVLTEAKNIVEQIPSAFERIEHYESLASMTSHVDPALCKECLKKAMKETAESNDPGVIKSQRKLIDLAHRVDPELASSFASLINDDEAREDMRKKTKQRIQVLELKKRLVDPQADEAPTRKVIKECSQAAWMLLGSLNANRIGYFEVQRIRQLVELASRTEFINAYPILACIIESSVKKWGRSDQANTILRPIFEAMLLGTELSGRTAKRSSAIVKHKDKTLTGQEDSNNILVKANDREKAIQYIRDWLTKEMGGYIKICDPYFGIDDLELLQIIAAINPSCKVYILTSIKHQTDKKITSPWSEAYLTHWRVRISDLDPPYTRVVCVGSKSKGEPPIHDRWWITERGGLRVGTSFNSLGLTKSSEISILKSSDANLIETELDEYLGTSKTEHLGELLRYETFTLM